MNTITIESKDGQEREFEFLCWKDDGLAFYATSSARQPVVITLKPAYPNWGGRPYRFSNIVPLKISLKSFRLAWPPHYLEVLQKWRDAKKAEVDTYAIEILLSSEPKDRAWSKEEIKRVRQQIVDTIEQDYKDLAETPFSKLLTYSYVAVLHHFEDAKWAAAMGEDYIRMRAEYDSFRDGYSDTYQEVAAHNDEILSAFQAVQFVMEEQNGKCHYLSEVNERVPTDKEIELYEKALQMLQVAHRPEVRKSSSPQPEAQQRRAWFQNDFSIAVVIQPNGKPLALSLGHELAELARSIHKAGGRITRAKLREGKGDSYQPEKLLERSTVAEAIVNVGLLGKTRTGRRTVFWLTERVG